MIEPIKTPADDPIAKLEGLLAAATKGSWEVQDGCSWRRIGTREGNGNVLCPDTYSREDRHPDLTAGKGEDVYANLRLIVAAKNALPALIECARALERIKREDDQTAAWCRGIAKTALDNLNAALGRVG